MLRGRREGSWRGMIRSFDMFVLGWCVFLPLCFGHQFDRVLTIQRVLRVRRSDLLSYHEMLSGRGVSPRSLTMPLSTLFRSTM